MSRIAEWISWSTDQGAPVIVGPTTATPVNRALVVRLPNGGWVWNRPTAVLVTRAGRTDRVPIWDVTRITQVALLALPVAFGLLRLLRRAPGGAR